MCSHHQGSLLHREGCAHSLAPDGRAVSLGTGAGSDLSSKGSSAQLSDGDAALEPVKLSVRPAVGLPGSLSLDTGLNISEPPFPPV